MNQLSEKISKIALFKDVDIKAIRDLMDKNNCHIKDYNKGSPLAHEGETCHGIGLILQGKLYMEKYTDTGEVLTIRSFHKYDVFGIALYGKKFPRYPFTIKAEDHSKVLFIPFQEVKMLLESNSNFNENFILLLCQQVHLFKEKLELLQHKDVRSRLVKYLNRESKFHKSNAFSLRHSKVDISHQIGVARPSVSREFKHMVEDEIIKLSGQKIKLLDNFYKINL